MNRTETNIFDRLLYYLSHVGTLSWEKFKQTVNRLTRDKPDFKESTYLTCLARLGHIDFDPTDLSHVAIGSASLVETAVADRYVLVGSRTPDFLKKTRKCVAEIGGKFCLHPEKYAPMTIVLSGLQEPAFSALESLEIHISRAFSAKMSKVLPRPKRTSFKESEILLPNSIKKFNPETLKYETHTDSLQNYELYETPRYGSDVYILRSAFEQRKMPRDWGEWLVLSISGKTTGLISYEKNSQIWRVKRPLLVPLIIDRCATLCSGFPPKNKKGFMCYSDVPAGIAYQLTKSLYQDWEIV